MTAGFLPPPDMVWLAQQFPDLANLQPLSQGGQKLVFSATHSTDGEVVLKLVHNSQPEEVRREILAVAQIASPRVPLVLEHGVIAMPLGLTFWMREQRIVGDTVRQLLSRGPLAPSEALRLGLHILQILVRAERATIVHRDVKPDNIIRDNTGDYWLLDFGLARHLALVSQTATALPFGKMTFGYAPPEQCRNMKRAIDSRADLFALGVTMYESATGGNPFRQGTIDPLEMLRRVETLPLPPLTLMVRSPAEVRDLVATLTQKRRDHRPRTAADALIWMEEICANEGI